MKISNKYAADVIRVMLEDNEKEPWRPTYLSGIRLEALAMAVKALDRPSADVMIDHYERLYEDFYMYLNDLQFSIAPDERHQGRERERREELADLLQYLMEEMLHMHDKMNGGETNGETKMET